MTMRERERLLYDKLMWSLYLLLYRQLLIHLTNVINETAHFKKHFFKVEVLYREFLCLFFHLEDYFAKIEKKKLSGSQNLLIFISLFISTSTSNNSIT